MSVTYHPHKGTDGVDVPSCDPPRWKTLSKASPITPEGIEGYKSIQKLTEGNHYCYMNSHSLVEAKPLLDRKFVNEQNKNKDKRSVL